MAQWRVLGVDFSSRPSRRKPIMVAHLIPGDDDFALEAIEPIVDFAGFDALLCRAGPWLGGFDLPFGLPREFVQSQGWPLQWGPCMDIYASLSREQLRTRFRAFCDARPPGTKFAHRRTDGPAGASPSMKWVNPPVAWMMHAGVPRLREAGVMLPGLQDGDPTRVAVEAYPGMLARAVTRRSYKTDDLSKADASRARARACILASVIAAEHCDGVRVRVDAHWQERIIDDPRGDLLDALLCAVQAAWCLQRADNDYGVPAMLDPLEGWIAAAE